MKHDIPDLVTPEDLRGPFDAEPVAAIINHRHRQRLAEARAALAIELESKHSAELAATRAAIKDGSAALERARLVHQAITTHASPSAEDKQANQEHCDILSAALAKLAAMRTHLDVALSHWRLYHNSAGEDEREDLKTLRTIEGDYYRAALELLKKEGGAV